MILSFFVTIVITLLISCDTTEPPKPDNRKLTLTLEDASCTEVWLKLTTSNLQLPTTIALRQNDQDRSIINLVKEDTLIYIDSLLPNNAYTFKVEISSNQQQVTSNEITATTMDTTSHDFTWQNWTFGGGGEASFVNDVAIINENNIWACGEIYLKDSLGNPDPIAYNAVHWDGNNWKPKRISTEFRGNIITVPLEGAFAFSANDIWFAGSLPIHGDGENWQMFDIRSTTDPNLSVSKAWGTNSGNIYFVGRGGSIGYYNGQNWQKIESGTDVILGDIWGIQDGKGGYNKYCATIDALLKLDAGNTLQRINTEQGHSISSIWGFSDKLIYTAGGSGLAIYRNYKWETNNEPATIYMRIVRGQNYNDVFGLGASGSIIHFNGYSWYSFNTVITNVHYRLDVKNNLIAAVGWRNDDAIITICKRN